MKILFIARNYPPSVGGAEKLNYDLANNLKKHVDVRIVANKFGKYSPIFHVYAFFKSIFAEKDIIFLSDPFLSPLIPLFKIFKKPIVIKVHGLDITYPNKIYQWAIPRLTNMVDKVICISRATKEECVKRKIDSEKCVVIPVGIDCNEFFIDEDKGKLRRELSQKLGVNLNNKKILLSVGRLVERKGFHWFIDKVMPLSLIHISEPTRPY